MRKLYTLFIVVTYFLIASVSHAQPGPPPLTKTEQKEVIDNIGSLLNENYVFPEMAQKMAGLLSTNYKNGAYTSITDPMDFATRLTQDLRSVSKDKHINVNVNPKLINELRSNQSKGGGGQPPASALENWKTNNFGFQEVKILEGNIAYIDLRQFVHTKYASETAIAAMNFVSNANALIIDLRKNGGGSPSMIQLITSYLYDAEPVHLNNFYFRPSNQNTQTWTLPFVPGKRRPDIDVYVLTSKKTFSAAEEFTYNLKNLKRATIIGETTGGGANPGGNRIVNDRFLIFVPTGRAINPITNTNWEGTGVKPDIEARQEEALLIAREKAIEKLATKHSGNPNNPYQWALTSIKAQRNPLKLDEKELSRYAGTYGPASITLQNGSLYFKRTAESPEFKLIPLEKNLFDLEGIAIRVKFDEEEGNITGMSAVFQNGNLEKFSRNKGF